MAISRIYVGDVGTKVIVMCGEDLSAATKTSIKVRKPGVKAEIEWPAQVDQAKPAEMYYFAQAGDFDVVGQYALQAYVELPTWRGHGETVLLDVRKRFS